MVISTAWWGLGFSALLVSTVTFGWYLLRRDKATGLAALLLTLISTVLLWIGMIGRAAGGRDWPFATSTDSAAGIALIMLLLYSVWKLFSQEQESGFTVTATALVLISYSLGQQTSYPFHEPIPPAGVLIGTLLKLCGGSLLAMAAAISVTPLLDGWLSPRPTARIAHVVYDAARSAYPSGIRNSNAQSDPAGLQQMSEMLVRGALLCLALSLAIDTWWLQKVGLGNANDAQQAGIALAWMVYFIALRLRANPRWRGWPWAAILSIGFFCVLPILIDAPWLEMTLPI